MSEPAATPESLQFDRAEFQQPAAATTCVACNTAITGTYFEVNGKLVCPGCEQQLRASRTGGSRARRALTALVFGVAAALAGALLYSGVARLTGYNIGLVAIAVGWMVGTAVSRGSSGRGGVGYQLLALVLTYVSVGMSIAPEALAQAGSETSGAGRIFLGVFVTLTGPVFVGMEAPLSGLIYGFGLWEAWRRNARVKLEVSGPFQVAQAGTAAAVSVEAPPASAAAGDARVG